MSILNRYLSRTIYTLRYYKFVVQINVIFFEFRQSVTNQKGKASTIALEVPTKGINTLTKCLHYIPILLTIPALLSSD